MKENRLWYDQPAKDWNEALPLGNGRLGMMVYGGVAEERVQLNEETFWSGWEDDGSSDDPETLAHLDEMRRLVFEGRYSEAQQLCNRYLVCRGPGHSDVQGAFGSYQTAGELFITFPHFKKKTAGYVRDLRLDEGRATVTLPGMTREFFVSYRYNTAVIRVTGCPEGTALRYERENCRVEDDGEEIRVSGNLPLAYALRIRRTLRDGVLTVFLTAATAYGTDRDPMAVCGETLDAAQEAGADALREETRAYFSDMLGRVSLTLPGSGGRAETPTDRRLKEAAKDPGLAELYFNFGRYLLVGSSRGKLPANLQGIWCKDYEAPWSADYHININIQMNYWFAETCNLPELIDPFFGLIRLIAAHGDHTARVAYGCPGWVAHFTTNPWGYTALGQNPVYGAFPTAGAWCLRHIKERWLFSGDTAVLREFYPVISGASEFFLSYLVRDPRTGYLVTAPAGSPENSFLSPTDGSRVNVCAGPTMDISIIRELFEFHLAAAKALQKDDPLAPRLREALSQLPPLRIGKYGQIMEWPEEFEEAEPGHRHMSHLYGLYPAAEITASTPALFEAARKTIERRLAHGGGHTGWSRAWIVNFFARLADGNAAHENLVALFTKSTLNNLFDNHPPFQIDGNFGGTAGIAEMLLQSHDGVIDLLPALPEAWPEGSFDGLMARGGFRVSAAWRNGRVIRCRVEGKDDAPFRLRFNGQTTEAAGRFAYDAP